MEAGCIAWGIILPYMYQKEEKLDLSRKIGITEDVYKILRDQKKKQKISMAKIVCNVIKKTYENNKI